MLTRQQIKVLRHSFAKANAGVYCDAVFCRTQSFKRGGLPFQESQHLRHHIALHRFGLHGSRFAVHVHQAHAAVGVRGYHRQRTGLAQRPNVVDDVCAQVKHGLHHLGLVGINRDGHAEG